MQEQSQRKQFIDTFLEKNKEINLSAIRDADGVYIKHVLDSIELDKVFPIADGARVIDV
jgi:16S rRNA G527 N7-methylase RsmG